MIVRAASDADVRAAFAGVDPARAAELTATSWHDDVTQLAEELLAVRAASPLTRLFAIAAAPRSAPAALVGVVPFGPGIGGMIWAPTAAWSLLALASHRWWRSMFVPDVLAGAYRRVEFTALAADLGSRRWLKVLGFTEEGTAYRQGKGGEDFVHMAWLNPDPAFGVARPRDV